MRIEHHEEAQPFQKARRLPVMAEKVVKLILNNDTKSANQKKIYKSMESGNKHIKILVYNFKKDFMKIVLV